MDLLAALQLNNEGVRLLLAGNDVDGMTYLTDALTRVKTLLSSGQGADSMAYRHGVSITPPNVQFMHGATYKLAGLQDDCCFIYGNALIFNLDNKTLPSSDHVHIYTSVIILNVTLAYHRRGLSANAACLFKAEKMYEMVGKLLSTSTAAQGTELLVKTAAINNLSQLRYDHGDYAFAREGFQYLASLISYAGEGLQAFNGEEDVYRGMVLNALLVTPPETAPAA